ncbi:MAG: PD-(D/E)XK nuclease family protein [Chloroflexi bacterium]|nr:PD-(D/E)XK nuclease family protein [Chloroflexota bacterium]
MDEHTLRVLEFDKILARLARLTSFSAGRELALALRPSTERDEVVRRQRSTAEARRLRSLQPRVGLGGAHDVRRQADKAARGGVLQPSELLDIASTLAAAGDLRATIRRFSDELPLLAALADELEPLPELVAEINRSIDQRAEVTDAASATLAVLRREVRIAHDRLNSRLQEFIHSSRYRDAIQEPIVTLRDGRAAIELPFEVPVPGTPFRVRGVLDRICTFGPDTYVEDYKLTGSTLSTFWFALHGLSVQVPLYDWAVRRAFPELEISGVLIEGIWTGVTMCRIDRKTFHRNVAERAEFEADLIEHLTAYRARAIRGVFPRAWSRTACQGCEYGPLCGRSPGAREIEEGAAYRVDPRERTYE